MRFCLSPNLKIGKELFAKIQQCSENINLIFLARALKFFDDQHAREYSEVLGRHIEVETALHALEEYTPGKLFSDLKQELDTELKKAASELDKLSEVVRSYLDSLKKEDANADAVFKNVTGELEEVSERMRKNMEEDRELIARSAELKVMQDVHNLRLHITRVLLDTTRSYRKFALELIKLGIGKLIYSLSSYTTG